jgi:hypothetical protein
VKRGQEVVGKAQAVPMLIGARRPRAHRHPTPSYSMTWRGGCRAGACSLDARMPAGCLLKPACL